MRIREDRLGLFECISFELAQIPGEPIIDKSSNGSVCATNLELMLRLRALENLILTGIPADVCVYTTMRESDDYGFDDQDAGGVSAVALSDALIEVIG